VQKVSVIIPNYNYGRFLRQAIQSALGQSLKPHEVIVVDDGSTDDSNEILRSFGDQIIAVEQENSGVGAARNKGAEIASGDLLAFLDADDYWHSDKLKKQVRKFESDTEIGFVHCGLTNVDENGAYVDDYLAGDEGRVADRLLRFQPVVIATTVIVRRDVFLKIGGYDTSPDLHPSEDWDLCYRLSRETKLGFVREPLHYYRHHGQGGHTNIERMERAMLIAYKKAFATPSKDLRLLRDEAYGNLYMVLAGSYYHAGQVGNSVRCALKSLAHKPILISKLLAFPFRNAKRAFN
jgi:glycosyltransferase involved in cell wall biosynthesis